MIKSCFKKRTSDATKIRRFFCLCKHFCIVVTVSHLSLLRIFCARTKDLVSKDVRFLKHNCIFKTVISDCNTQTYA
ncbi:hypothetical protein F2Z87_17560 [Bacteroides fragilis]|nr:hypothetical protein F2Z87_17560 [Bacteroides fragilis]KAA5021748.1 hypothetical protein F2Z76_19040 [Bacteroides fragilis]